jgi:hypothetical protein
LFFQNLIRGQEVFKGKNIDSVFNTYTKPFQEVIYSHLNKSKYIKGETIGFTAYAFDKQKKKLSNTTSNLYCVISDKDNKLIKKQLIKVENGIANSQIKIDSAFTSGIYSFKAYTNWLLNFSEQNYFTDTFEVIEANKTSHENKTDKGFEIDAQILPESGHILSNIINTMGAIVKDKFGFGIPNLKGNIVDSNNKIITSFTLNKLGIGRFSFIPKINQNYKAVIDNNGKIVDINFTENIKLEGVLLKVSRNTTHALISIITNEFSKSKFKNKKLKLLFHDGFKLNKIDFDFETKLSITKKIPFKNLSQGINIFTLFDENDTPLAERLFFNYEGLKIIESKVTSIYRLDSLIRVGLNYHKANNIGFNNVSVSVLPQQTKSYHKNVTIISQTLIQPYIKGTIENGGYYFTNITKQKQYDLDNLLITQGWSSYNWSTIFNAENNLIYQQEKGISIKVNIPKLEKESAFLVHHISSKGPEYLSFKEEIKSFQMYEYYPEDKENLYISEIGRKGNLNQPSLYIQYFPSSIPNFNKQFKTLNPIKNYYSQEVFLAANNFENLNETQVLNEIFIKANLEEKRIETIKNKSFGRVYFLNENERNQTLANFLNNKPGLSALDNFQTNTLQVFNRTANATPALILDGYQVFDNQLFYYWLDVVDYIEVSSTMTVGFATGRGGSISIFTDPFKYSKEKNTVSKFDFPLTFTAPKKFYSPKYPNYNSQFYKEYGVIDWLPINKIDNQGNIELNFTNVPLKNITLFIEGVTEDGTFILEEKTIEID